MRTTLTVISIILLSLAAMPVANACSARGGYKIVKPVSYPFKEDFTPPRPNAMVEKLERGFDDGNFASCSDAGLLTIVVEDRPHPDVVGYTFRLRDGSFPDEVFPEAVLAPVDFEHGRRGFRFVWLDLPQGQHRPEPIEATVEVRRVARSGKESEPFLLHVMHPGG